MTKEERQHWIDRWNRLKPSYTIDGLMWKGKRDMAVKIWGGKPLTPKRDEKVY